MTEKTLENAWLRVEIGCDGLLSILDKKTQRTYSKQHQVRQNREQGDSYNAAPVLNSRHQIEYAQAVFKYAEVLSEGPLRGSIKMISAIAESNLWIETVIFLDAGSSLLSFRTQFMNTQKDSKIQVCFVSEKPVETVFAEGHFNIVARHYDKNYQMHKAMPAEKFKELKTNTGSIQRFIAFEKQVLYTKGLAEYEVHSDNYSVALTLLRSFGMLSRDDTGVRGSHAGHHWKPQVGSV